MRRVTVQGIFDIPHPGHVHYLSDAASLGDELHVIIACGESVAHKSKPILNGRQCRDVAVVFDVVDEAYLGHVEDIFAPIEEIDFDVIVLGYDQHHDEGGIKVAFDVRSIDCKVTCATPRELRHDDELPSTGRIIDRIVERHC